MYWCLQLCIGKANPPTWRTIIIAVYFIFFFLLNGNKWPFRFVALKFKCTNIYKQLACSVLCFIKKGGEGVGWKRWGVGDKEEWGKLSFWGVGMGKDGKQSLWWLIKHIFQILTKGERLKRWLWNSLQWPNYVINLVGSTKLQCYTLPSMQFYSFIRNLPPLSTSNCFAHVFNISKGQNLF